MPSCRALWAGASRTHGVRGHVCAVVHVQRRDLRHVAAGVQRSRAVAASAETVCVYAHRDVGHRWPAVKRFLERMAPEIGARRALHQRGGEFRMSTPLGEALDELGRGGDGRREAAVYFLDLQGGVRDAPKASFHRPSARMELAWNEDGMKPNTDVIRLSHRPNPPNSTNEPLLNGSSSTCTNK